MFCNKCGNNMPQGEIICRKCGNNMGGGNVHGFVQCSNCGAQISRESNVCQVCGMHWNGQKPVQNTGSKSNGLIIGLLVALIVILIIIVIGFSGIFDGKTTSRVSSGSGGSGGGFNRSLIPDIKDTGEKPEYTHKPEQTPVPTPKPTPEPQHTYSVVVSHITWNEARAAAERTGGHLVTFSNREEFDKVISILSDPLYSSVKNVWIGAYAPNGYNSYEAASSYWYSDAAEWITGEPFTFHKWRHGEPSGYDAQMGVSERYVQIFRPKADGGEWTYNDAGDDISEYKPNTLAYVIEYE